MLITSCSGSSIASIVDVLIVCVTLHSTGSVIISINISKVVIILADTVDKLHYKCSNIVIWLAIVYLISLLISLSGLGQLTSHLNPFNFTISHYYLNLFVPLTISGMGVCLITTLILVSIYLYHKIKEKHANTPSHKKHK